MCTGTCGLVAMTSASHAEGRQFDPGQVYFEKNGLLVDAKVCVECYERVANKQRRQRGDSNPCGQSPMDF